MTGDLTGRTAIVTGASRGIGLAIAEALVQDGASVVLTSRNRDAAEAAAVSLGTKRVAGYGANAADQHAAAAYTEPGAMNMDSSS
jgi:NAD(P)-dependent dehydrogenase (short-subunit alcohol dehydrogenase family)